MTIQSLPFSETFAVNPQFSSTTNDAVSAPKKGLVKIISHAQKLNRSFYNPKKSAKNVRIAYTEERPQSSFLHPFGASEFISRAVASLSSRLVRDFGTIKRLPESHKTFYSEREPAIGLHSYFNRLVNNSKWSPSAFVNGLILIDRLLEMNPDLSLSTLNVHRVLMTAFMVGVKVNEDISVGARVFALVGGTSQKEIIRMEAMFLQLVEFRVFVSPSQYSAKMSHLSCIELKNSDTQRRPPSITSVTRFV